jgi:hypothetical protein
MPPEQSKREALMSEDFEKAAHNYLMDNQDSTMTQNIAELLGDWALDAFNAGWDARQERIKELEEQIQKYYDNETLSLITEEGADDVWCRTCRGAGSVGPDPCPDCSPFKEVEPE